MTLAARGPRPGDCPPPTPPTPLPPSQPIRYTHPPTHTSAIKECHVTTEKYKLQTFEVLFYVYYYDAQCESQWLDITARPIDIFSVCDSYTLKPLVSHIFHVVVMLCRRLSEGNCLGLTIGPCLEVVAIILIILIIVVVAIIKILNDPTEKCIPPRVP